MPFCSLEEAWGSDFQKINNESKKFNKIVNKYDEVDYSDISMNSDICEEPLKKKYKKKKSFARSYNRLKNHNGPKTRLPENNEYIIDSKSIETSLKDVNENFTETNDYVNYLISENKQLKNMIAKYKNNNDGIFDLVLFLSSGVFIIFLLDILTKNIRRF
jgi:hypothetical protein